MTIYRNGVEIELTNDELKRAGWEYQHICDVEDIRTMADFYCGSEEEFMESYGITRDVLDEIIEKCAVRYRRYEDENNNWFDNANDAIRDVVIELGLDKED